MESTTRALVLLIAVSLHGALDLRAQAALDTGGGPALYAAGDANTPSGGPQGFVARWDGTAWSPASSWPAGLPAGFEMDFQYWIDDPGGPFGFTASNALQAVTP